MVDSGDIRAITLQPHTNGQHRASQERDVASGVGVVDVLVDGASHGQMPDMRIGDDLQQRGGNCEDLWDGKNVVTCEGT
jgi:hypothetical protein